VKVVLFFFDYRGVVHHEYALPGQTVNKEYYQNVLSHLPDAVRRERPKLWDTSIWQLHPDTTPAHLSHLIQGFLAKHGTPHVRQAPYSPDIPPCDFWLFQRLKLPF
jgi:histone-lysine N-methyltransferase SETMAR